VSGKGLVVEMETIPRKGEVINSIRGNRLNLAVSFMEIYFICLLLHEFWCDVGFSGVFLDKIIVLFSLLTDFLFERLLFITCDIILLLHGRTAKVLHFITFGIVVHSGKFFLEVQLVNQLNLW
jgi:hypothetical protein